MILEQLEHEPTQPVPIVRPATNAEALAARSRWRAGGYQPTAVEVAGEVATGVTRAVAAALVAVGFCAVALALVVTNATSPTTNGASTTTEKQSTGTGGLLALVGSTTAPTSTGTGRGSVPAEATGKISGPGNLSPAAPGGPTLPASVELAAPSTSNPIGTDGITTRAPSTTARVSTGAGNNSTTATTTASLPVPVVTPTSTTEAPTTTECLPPAGVRPPDHYSWTKVSDTPCRWTVVPDPTTTTIRTPTTTPSSGTVVPPTEPPATSGLPADQGQ